MKVMKTGSNIFILGICTFTNCPKGFFFSCIGEINSVLLCASYFAVGKSLSVLRISCLQSNSVEISFQLFLVRHLCWVHPYFKIMIMSPTIFNISAIEIYIDFLYESYTIYCRKKTALYTLPHMILFYFEVNLLYYLFGKEK